MSSNPNAKHSQMAPLSRAVRAYIAPVGRPSGPIVAYDPAAEAQFDLDAPPSSWLDLGWVENFQRTAATKYEALRNGPLGNITVQYRSQPEARVEFDLPSWGKLQMALAGGTGTLNALATQPMTGLRGSGGDALPASPLQSGSTVSSLVLTNDQLGLFQVGDLVAVLRDLGLDVGGLMTVAAPGAAAARAAFESVGRLADQLGLEERSMGMTDDLEAAVAAGTTMVRVGRALFGDRPPRDAG